MKELGRFELALHSMIDGMHQFEYEIDEIFFSQFDQELIQGGNFTIQVDLEKNAEIIVLDIHHRGAVHTTCDRCTEDIDLPIGRYCAHHHQIC